MSETVFPSVVQVEPTNYCNLSCPRCPMRTMTYPKGVMSNEVFAAIINECEGHHVLVKLFFLGEPLLHPDLDAMLTLAAVWNSRKLHAIHDAIKQKQYGSYACKNCKVYYHRFKNKPLQVSKHEYDMLSDGMKAGMKKRN